MSPEFETSVLGLLDDSLAVVAKARPVDDKRRSPETRQGLADEGILQGALVRQRQKFQWREVGARLHRSALDSIHS